MPQTRKRNSSPVPEVTWDTGLKEMNETWKGAIACLGVAVFFVMTIGIIYWQVVDQPNKNWILKGSISGLIWERKTQTLVLQTLNEEKTFAEIDVGNVGKTDAEIPFIRNLCWFNKTEFCYTWDSLAEVKIYLELTDSDTECYYVSWTPLRCYVGIKNCFSMANISWYGGATVKAPTWPINNANISLQPFVVSDLKDNPSGFGSVLERYFLGSSGVSVIVAPEVPLLVGLEHRRKYCLQTPPSMENLPLQYTICVGPNLKTVHQESMQQLFMTSRETPDMSILQLPIWKLLGNVDSGAKLEKELRTFAIHLQKHAMEKSVISLDGRSTDLLANTNQKHRNGKKHGKKPNRDLSFVKRLNISITLSPYVSVSSMEFQSSIQDGVEDFWLSLPLGPQGHLVPLLTRWKGKYSVKLNITKPEATRWFLDKVNSLHEHLDMEYIILEGGEGNTFEKQTLHTPIRLDSDDYVRLFAELAERIGDNAILTSGARSNHKPLFICMNELYSDWSYSGLKGIVPSLLHYSLLGYNFFLSDAVGGSRPADMMVDEELFVRWLEIAAFFPVISFQTPPWLFDKEWILNLTRFYIEKHNELVVPLIRKYAAEWENDGSPIYRPLWWISPEDPLTFTIDDQFLIGDEVLVSPVTEKGATRRDIYLPGSFCQWQDMSNDQVFDGGTFLENYPVGLGDVPLFRRRRQPGGR